MGGEGRGGEGRGGEGRGGEGRGGEGRGGRVFYRLILQVNFVIFEVITNMRCYYMFERIYNTNAFKLVKIFGTVNRQP